MRFSSVTSSTIFFILSTVFFVYNNLLSCIKVQKKLILVLIL